MVRGKHATGIVQVKGQCSSVNNFKLAYPAPIFLDLPVVQQELLGFSSNTVAIGHNRHATKGASDSHANAHPFEHGHISMVHNGSLTTWLNLTTETYSVDSEAICRALELDGPEVVIPKLRGAFVLVWVDSIANTLNFVRNSERTMAIAVNENTNKMWWASEIDMLNWSLNRDLFSRNPVNYTEIFNLPTGVLFSIPITATGIDLKGSTKTAIDVSNSVYEAPSYSRYQGYNSTVGKHWDSVSKRWVKDEVAIPEDKVVVHLDPLDKKTPYSFGKTKEKEMTANATSLLTSAGKTDADLRNYISSVDVAPKAAILDDRIGVFVTGWEPYAHGKTTSGKLLGVMIEYPFSKVVIHATTQSDYTACVEKAHGIISSYISGFNKPEDLEDFEAFTILLRVDLIRRADIEDHEWDITKIPVVIKQGMEALGTSFVAGPFGVMVTLNEWVQLTEEGCSTCKEVTTDVTKAESIQWITDTEYVCGACHFELANMGH